MASPTRATKIYTKRRKKDKYPTLLERWATETPNDMHVFADDLRVKTPGAHEIYPELKTLDECSIAYEIYTNWDKIKIIAGEQAYTTYELRIKTPGK